MKKKSIYALAVLMLLAPISFYVWQVYMVNVIDRDINEMPTSAGPPPSKWKSGQILVKPKEGLSEKEFKNIVGRHQGAVIDKLGSLQVHIINVPAQAEEAVVRALSQNPHIEFAELDMAVALSMTVNDPRFSSAWHLPKIQAPTAWDSARGDGVTIAILDSGVDGSHPDLVNQLLPGYNAVDGSSNTADITGHGTATAGTAAAATNNGIGVASIAGNAKILPIRVSNAADGYAYWSDVTRGLNWAADHSAKVANISYDGVTNSSSVSTAAQYLRSKGGLVVVAAGNSGIDPGFANNPNMITVSATNSSDVKASWSNFGNFIDVAAPGDSIASTAKGGLYGTFWGTSFASPVTAGVVALIMSANPALLPTDVENVLKNSAVKLSGVNFDPKFGYGRVNASAAVQLAKNTVPADTQAPVVAITSPTGGAIVNGLISVDANATDNVAVNQVSLYANANLIGTDSMAPFQFSWDSATVADGNVSLTAIATDAAGNKTTSSAVAVSVKNQPTPVDQVAPTVSISNPKNGSKVSGTVAIAVNATDDIAVAKVQLFIDNALVGVSSSPSLNYSWNTRKAATGSHSINAVATDSAGKSSSLAISVSK